MGWLWSLNKVHTNMREKQIKNNTKDERKRFTPVAALGELWVEEKEPSLAMALG